MENFVPYVEKRGQEHRLLLAMAMLGVWHELRMRNTSIVPDIPVIVYQILKFNLSDTNEMLFFRPHIDTLMMS